MPKTLGKKLLLHLLLLKNKREHAEKKLAWLTPRYQAILDAVPDIIMEMDANQIYTWANHAGINFFGSDIVGKPITNQFIGNQPETHTKLTNLLNGAEEVIYIESWQFRKDSERRLLAWWCRALKDQNGKVTGAISSAHDITEIRAAHEHHNLRTQAEKRERELKKWNEELQQEIEKRKAIEAHQQRLIDIIEASPDLISFSDAKQNIYYYNPAGIKLLGIDSNKVNKVIIANTHTKKSAKLILTIGIPTAIKQGIWQGETEFVNQKTGKTFIASQVILAHKSRDGKVEYLSTIAKDITDRKNMEETLRKNNEELKQEIEKRKKIESNQQRLIATIEASPNLIAIATADTITRYMNPAGRELVGFEGEDITKLPISAAHTPASTDLIFNTAIPYTIKYGTWAGETEFINHKTGEIITTSQVLVAHKSEDGKLEYLSTIVSNITDRKKMEENLRKNNEELKQEIEKRKRIEASQQRFIDIIETSPDLVAMLNPDRYVYYMNHSGKKMLSFENTDITQLRAPVSHTKNSEKIIRDEAIPAAIKQGSWQGETEFINQKTGEIITTTETVMAHKSKKGELTYISAIARDITERKKMEETLRKNEERYRMLTKISPVGIFHYDNTGACTYVNDYCAALLSMSNKEAKGYDWKKSVHPDDLEKIFQELECADRENRAFNLEYRLIKPNGDVRWVHGEITAVKDKQGNILEHVGTCADFTKLQEAKDQLQLHQTELAHYDRLNTIGEMASGIAHELNQPLTAIVQYLGGCLIKLQHENIAPPIIEVMQKTINQAELAGQIIHRLKNFLRKSPLQKTKSDINLIIHEAIAIIEHEIKKNNITLQLALAEDLPQIEMDAIQIEQVILNVIMNAIESMQTVKTRPSLLQITTSIDANNYLEIIITDTGPGIPNNIADKIFTPFFTTKHKGMGMGLTICQSIFDLHQGRILLDLDYQNGAKFTLKLPIEYKETT